MADNTQLNSGTGGDVVATDDIGGVKHQRVKVEFGADGSATDVSAADPLPVTSAAQPGVDIGDVTINNASGGSAVNIQDGGNSITVDNAGTFAVQASLSAAIPAGTNNIGDVDVLTVPAPLNVTGGGVESGTLRVTLASDTTGVLTVKQATAANLNALVGGPDAHDAAVAANPVTVAGRGSDAVPTATSADGDVTRLWVDKRGAAKAALVDDAGDSCMDGTNNAVRVNLVSSSVGSTEYTEDAAAAADPAGSATILVRKDTPATITSADGDNVAQRGTNYGAAYVQVVSSTGSFVDTFGGGTQYTEDAAAAADPVGTAPILVRKDTPATITSADGDNIAQRGTNYGAAYVQVVSSTGSFVDTFGGGTQYTEDAAAATDPTGNMLLARRRDSLASETSADGDNTALNATAKGELYVKHVDPIPAGTNNIGDVDVLTVPAPLSTSGNGTAASALRVTVASDSTGVIGVTDNGGSITVDNAGTFNVQAAVQASATNIAKAEDAASANADVGVPAMAVQKATPANTAGTDGDYEFLQMSAGRLWTSATVDTALPAGTNNIGDVDVLTVPAPLNVTGGGAEASALRVTIANDSTGVVSIDDNGGSITVDGTLTSVTSVGSITGDVSVKGTTAHDAAVSTDPILTGARASTAIPTAVSADGDVTRLWASRQGALKISIVDGDGDSCMDDTNAALKTVLSTAIPAGTNNIGDVDVLSLPAIPAGTNNIGDVDVLTVPAPLSTSGNGTAASALRVTVASDSTGVLTVQQSTAANLKIDISGTAANTTAILVKEQRPASSAITTVVGSASSVSLLASNSARFGASIYNDSTALLYVKLGTTASTSSFTVKVQQDGYYEVPFGYTGAIDGIWASATGNARITEITA